MTSNKVSFEFDLRKWHRFTLLLFLSQSEPDVLFIATTTYLLLLYSNQSTNEMLASCS